MATDEVERGSLPSVPAEILFSITGYIETQRDVNALARANKLLYWKLNDSMYLHDVRTAAASALAWAAKRGVKKTAWMSITEGADIEAAHHVPIPISWKKSFGFTSDKASLTPLQIAVCYGSTTVAHMLIELGADATKLYPPELEFCTTLHFASGLGLTSLAKELINRGMDVNVRDKLLRTPLHFALTAKISDWPEQGRVVMWLLAKGAKQSQRDVSRLRTDPRKNHPNPLVKIQFKKGAKTVQYESMFQDRDIEDLKRLDKERDEAAAWDRAKKERQKAQTDAVQVAQAMTGADAASSASKQDRQSGKTSLRAMQAEEAKKPTQQEPLKVITPSAKKKGKTPVNQAEKLKAVGDARLAGKQASEPENVWMKHGPPKAHRRTPSEECQHYRGWIRGRKHGCCHRCGTYVKDPVVCAGCGAIAGHFYCGRHRW